MKRHTILLVAIFLLAPVFQYAQGLNREECENVRNKIIGEWAEKYSDHFYQNIELLRIKRGENSMPIWGSIFGEEPADGRSLWISMHGGGNAPQELNDEQWNNQKVLYEPNEGVYVCPRAPWNDWNMWFQEPIDAILEELIQTMVVTQNVNPDKVYIMGYSAGGDGVWRLAPRLADHWAAAAMMAGHPGDVGLENVRNLPFTIWVGGDDDAYNRNIEVAKRGQELDKLHKSDRNGYIHETHVLMGLPHWMERKDTAAVGWMSKYVRNLRPNKVVWKQEEVTRRYFYWLGAPEGEIARGMTVIARYDKNRIDIDQCDYSSLTIYLDDEMMNLDIPVEIFYMKKNIATITPERSEKVMRNVLDERGDIRAVFCCKIDLKLN